MPNITTFDSLARYIHLPIMVTSAQGAQHEFDAIFDTGAPRTEFSDRALHYAGLLKSIDEVIIPEGLQTQKYSHVLLPQVRICGHDIGMLDVFVSRFEESWGIDALIGLDFLRRFKTEIDYARGTITSEALRQT